MALAEFRTEEKEMAVGERVRNIRKGMQPGVNVAVEGTKQGIRKGLQQFRETVVQMAIQEIEKKIEMTV